MRTCSPVRDASTRRARLRPVVLVALLAAFGVASLSPLPARAGSSGERPTHSGTVTGADVAQLPLACASRRDLMPHTALKCDIDRHLPGAPTVVLWGDSHAFQMVPALRAAIGSRKVNLVGFLAGGCPVMDPRLSDAERPDASKCEKVGDLAVRYLRDAKKRHHPVRVVVAMDWELYHNNTTPQDATDAEFQGVQSDYTEKVGTEALTGTPRAFRTLGHLRLPTDVVGPMPMVYQNAPPCRAGNNPYGCDLPRRGALVDEQINLDRIADLMRRLDAPHRLISAANHMCTATRCRGAINGIATYYDQLHIGGQMSEQLGRQYFSRTVLDLLADAR